jgi:hypothetical protein
LGGSDEPPHIAFFCSIARSPSFGEDSVKVNYAVVVGDIVADNLVVRVKGHKLDVVNAFFGNAVDFEKAEARFLRVRHFKRGLFALESRGCAERGIDIPPEIL